MFFSNRFMAVRWHTAYIAYRNKYVKQLSINPEEIGDE